MDDAMLALAYRHICYFFRLDSSLDFDAAHAKVLATVLEVFAGPADKVVTPGFDVNNRQLFWNQGIFSPSVQHSQHLTQRLVLQRIPQVTQTATSHYKFTPLCHKSAQVDQISISMPNVHYFGVDFSKFTRIPGLKDSTAGEVRPYS